MSFAVSFSSANAAGLWLYEQGTPDVGTATAGMAARAEDAATAFANPAGMSRLKGSQAMVGIQLIYGDYRWDGEFRGELGDADFHFFALNLNWAF